MSRCVIIGHNGQDGRLLTESLKKSGHHVIGIGRGDLDLLNAEAVQKFLQKERPDSLYYLAAYHHSSEDLVKISDLELFRHSVEINLQGVISFLEGIRLGSPNTHLFYAASSHIFGQPENSPQTENTPFHPQNVYGISKAAGVEACRYYRRTHGIHASCGILYNHESNYRSEKFVSQKIIRSALAISREESDRLILGDLNAEIDWGYAPDFVEAMIRIVALDKADDFIIATGETHTVIEFVEIAFNELGLNWQSYVEVNSALLTKSQSKLVGDSSKLKAATGWQPTLNFKEMVLLLLKTQRD